MMRRCAVGAVRRASSLCQADGSRGCSATAAHCQRTTVVNGCAAIPLEVQEQVQREFARGPVATSAASTAEVFRKFAGVPSDYEVVLCDAEHVFTSVPASLLGGSGVANYVRSGQASAKAVVVAKKWGAVNEANFDYDNVYSTVPGPAMWRLDRGASYLHYTAADPQQGLEFNSFPYMAVPIGMHLVCDASGVLGSRVLDWSRHDVVYGTGDGVFSTNGVCYHVVREGLDFQAPAVSSKSESALLYDRLVMEWMLARGGLAYFEELASARSELLYEFMDGTLGFFKPVVVEPALRSRMHIAFTIGEDQTLCQQFFEMAQNLGWLDVSLRLSGVVGAGNVLCISLYNSMPVEAIIRLRDLMWEFQKRHCKAASRGRGDVMDGAFAWPREDVALNGLDRKPRMLDLSSSPSSISHFI